MPQLQLRNRRPDTIFILDDFGVDDGFDFGWFDVKDIQRLDLFRFYMDQWAFKQQFHVTFV
ncbi:hypothetical protein HanXRQr2_Chr16g0764011 [Helianthus annuus]|uniref:Uncharacterized protein n=1 Tax=Helianthus annuus TaxID=4232 RepID=A0A9K3DV80_HELAN|nr:hypothetical protein HanXRQr2_Chr16g0764011 [Helianthus annuus]KAJ0822455.1 hypothetical protein HanPSC8_Chr16g0732241 [Helianthus annuus]